MGISSLRLSSPRPCTQILAAVCLLSVPLLHAQDYPPVDIAQAQLTEIVDELSLTGTLTAPRSTRLSPEVQGRVAALGVDAGDLVEAGQTLLKLDDEIAGLELEQSRAALREAVAELEDARRRLGEARDLAARQGIADTEVRAREAEVRTDAAVVDRRRAELGYRQALLERYSLEAPFAGVIALRLTDLGEWVGPGNPVLELVAIDRLRLDLQVPQKYFGRVGRDTPVFVRLAASPDHPLTASITHIVPVSDPSARTFLARVALDNASGRWAPGMSARATLRLASGREGVVVPRDALIRYPDGRVTVWVTEGDGSLRRVSERQVSPGLAFGGRIEILAGLEAGASVVVRGNESLRVGQQVRVDSDE